MAELPGAVLFSCTHNSIRSPMAESILKHLHGHQIYVDSCGVREGEIDGFVIAVMDEIGIDVSRHKAKTFDDLEDYSYDLIISLSPEAQHKAVDMTHYIDCDVEFWNTFDPSVLPSEDRGALLGAYRQVRDQLMTRIKDRFPTAGAIDT